MSEPKFHNIARHGSKVHLDVTINEVRTIEVISYNLAKYFGWLPENFNLNDDGTPKKR